MLTVAEVADRQAPVAAGDLTEDLIARPIWRDQDVTEAGIPIVDVPLVTVGGGLGSFALVDTLRIAGLPGAEMRVLSRLDFSHQAYQHLVRVSQIPDYERLRSDSASVIDNIWGFPSFAVREAFAARNLAGFVKPLWNVLTEPILTNFYTPRATQAYTAVEREAARIQWPSMLSKGQVRMVRRRLEGGYFTILTPPEEAAPTRRVAYRSRFVHLAVGYPGVRFLADLQDYRQTHQDFTRVVNSYEPHEHVYEELQRRPGVVVVRGAGIVASRILQRLIEDRDNKGAQTTIWHVVRSYVGGPEGPPWFRRQGGDGWAFQAFNLTKSAWGRPAPGQARLAQGRGAGPLRRRHRWHDDGDPQRLAGAAQPRPPRQLLPPPRRRGDRRYARAGRHRRDESAIERRRRARDPGELHHRRHRARVRRARAPPPRRPARQQRREPQPDGPTERLARVRGRRHGEWRWAVYASGSMTFGGYYAPVDSFLGLQYAALRIADDLSRLGLVGRIGTMRSLREWWRWLRNEQI